MTTHHKPEHEHKHEPNYGYRGAVTAANYVNQEWVKAQERENKRERR